jgi:2-isopropylmalate synthase
VDYHEHSIGQGSDVAAICYVELKVKNGKPVFGVGKDSNIITAAIKALINGVNRAGV